MAKEDGTRTQLPDPQGPAPNPFSTAPLSSVPCLENQPWCFVHQPTSVTILHGTTKPANSSQDDQRWLILDSASSGRPLSAQFIHRYVHF